MRKGERGEEHDTTTHLIKNSTFTHTRVNDQLSDTSIIGHPYRENGSSYDRRSCAGM
jgi:hypothetical protein